MADTAPTFRGLIQSLCGDLLTEVSTCKVASVETYDPARQKITAQPLIRTSYLDEAGERQTERPAAIQNVPVAFFGCGKYRITFPIKRGDLVLLVFSDRSLDKWLQVGGELDPGDDRQHNINDAIALPGVFDFAHVPTDAPTDALCIHADKILLGSSAASTAIGLSTDSSVQIRDVVDSSDFADAIVAYVAAVAGSPAAAAAAYKVAIDALFAAKVFGAPGVLA